MEVQQPLSMQNKGAGREATLPPSCIYLWLDPIARTGYENMAADELLSRRPEAWLRVYDWLRPSVSFGYFDTVGVAAKLFPGEDVEYIRRWTGGGIVDHRKGHTYTLTLPAQEGLMYPPSDELYRWIHGALGQALRKNGVECQLLVDDAPDGGRSCWASPVVSDLVDMQGNKLGGAGQRRYRGAVLHQGLIQECEPAAAWPHDLAAALSASVILQETPEPYEGFSQELRQLCAEKYESEAWADESHGRRKPTPY